MHSKNKLALLGVAATLIPLFAMAQGQDEASKKLIESARYWQSKENYERAASIWNKVLLSNPNQAEALYGIAQAQLKKNNISGVNQSIDKLKKVDPNSRYIALIEQDVSLSSVPNAQILDKARLLGETDKFDEAVSQYNILLKGKIPQGPLALEYYDRLGHTANGWKNAKTGLERLSKESPNNPQISLALGNLLIRNESTRIEGSEQLSRLVTDPGIGGYASEGLRLGLTWMDVPQPKAFPLFEAYLKTHPDDVGIRGQLSAGIKQQQRLAQELASAPTPQDTRASDAYDLAKKSLANGDDVGARAALDKSLKLDPDNPWARLALARLYIKSGQERAAKDLMYTMPYRSSNDQANILFASAIFSTDLQNWKQAQVFLSKIPSKDRTKDMQDLQKTLKVREDIDYAIALSKQGRKPEALAALNQIEPATISNPELLTLLANAYIELNEPNSSLRLMRQAVAINTPPKTDDLLAYVRILLRAKGDAEAATVLATLQQRKLSAAERSNFNELLFTYSLQQADQLRAQGNLVAAEDRLAPLLVERPNDPLVITSLAAVYQSSGQDKKALDLYQQLIQKNPDNIDIQLGAARLALRMNNPEFANARLQKVLTLAPKDPDVIASVARIYRAEGKTQEAEALFERSLSLMSPPANNSLVVNANQQLASKQFTANSVPTIKDSTVPLPASSVTVASGNSAGSKTVYYQGVAPSESQRLVMADLNEIKQERSANLTLGTQIRNRSGNAGTSQLSDIETPLEILLPVSDGKAIVQVTPVSLNAGSFAPVTYGSNPAAINNALSQVQTTASGVGLSVGYKAKGVAVDVGTTPLGFTYSNFTGGIKLDGPVDDAKTLSYLVNVSSRPVTDSLLSFSGTKNNATGNQWGGVMASGGRLGLSKDLGGYGLYGSAGFYAVDGHNVASNTRREFGAGTYINIFKRPDSELTTGLNYTNLSYQQNLSYFTYGQGGYFSPQQYNALTIPIIWAASSEKLSYQLRAAVGYQGYSQNSSSYFPTNSAFQSASGNAMYSSQTSTGAAYNLAAGSEYQVAPKFFLGATAQTDNTATGTWHQWGAGVYLRYSFESISGPMALPLKPFTSPYGI
jgi:predicted Zn-dependent protease